MVPFIDVFRSFMDFDWQFLAHFYFGRSAFALIIMIAIVNNYEHS